MLVSCPAVVLPWAALDVVPWPPACFPRGRLSPSWRRRSSWPRRSAPTSSCTWPGRTGGARTWACGGPPSPGGRWVGLPFLPCPVSVWLHRHGAPGELRWRIENLRWLFEAALALPSPTCCLGLCQDRELSQPPWPRAPRQRGAVLARRNCKELQVGERVEGEDVMSKVKFRGNRNHGLWIPEMELGKPSPFSESCWGTSHLSACCSFDFPREHRMLSLPY